MLENFKGLIGWPAQPVKRSQCFAWPPSADEETSSSPSSSSVGPLTPGPGSEAQSQQVEARDTAKAPAAEADFVGDLIDLGPADQFAVDDAYDGLPPPLQPDPLEVNLVSYVSF